MKKRNNKNVRSVRVVLLLELTLGPVACSLTVPLYYTITYPYFLFHVRDMTRYTPDHNHHSHCSMYHAVDKPYEWQGGNARGYTSVLPYSYATLRGRWRFDI